mmetsp:Transcript_19358/g.31716  ORF Transcript_19358/g.31716 Transcript_19358/m.31716 type:complete len:181 (+) Transcript_19358:207-749(+)|eukprot:CAMPEP_0184644528 /NCGR_PEP_ID=MMETSP0308-20130426/1240_1 /TAXON_ID=38269 /ORGANISM="Gloeochaete witrockiana, Strain SAG 46.84" /LENGTH=180 /DNA_ID=CAMNT_0027073117 /DNA_START=196 /DNA_END=738 /DNA_ORIENTATION=+
MTPGDTKSAFSLLKHNMHGMYERDKGWNDRKKMRELREDDARFLLVKKKTLSTESGSGMEKPSLLGENEAKTAEELPADLLAFVHFRFTTEGAREVLYVYEIQLNESVTRKGLGKFLMQLIELIARRNKMKAVFLTVHKENSAAVSFYKNALKYNIDESSPDEADDAYGYLILSKIFPTA